MKLPVRGATVKKRCITKLLLIMKLATVLIFAVCLQASARSFSQTLTLKEFNAPFEKVLQEITRQSGYDFLYRGELVTKAKTVTIRVTKMDLKNVLDVVFKDQPFTYAIANMTIVVSPKLIEPVSPGAGTILFTDTLRNIKGTVTDESGNPVAGVSVKWKGTNKGTTTGNNGEYAISVTGNNAILIFSFEGYRVEQIPVTKNTVVNARLTVFINNLDEMVVVGYTAKKTSDITGSLQTIKGQDLRSGVSSANTLAMLKGIASGLYIVEPGGSVANRGQVVMHGQASFNDAGNVNFGPLIVLDGVITTAANLQDIVNPEDIETITVLKDASSTAIYGSRAAQGVIVVVTRRGGGANGQLKVNLNMNYGKVENNRAVRFMNTGELTTHITKYMHSLYDGTASLRTQYGSFDNYFNTTRIFSDADLQTNYQWDNNAFFTSGNQSDINLSLSSGTDKTKFYSAINWTKQDGTLLDDNLDRKSFRINVDQKISNKLTLSVSSNVLIDTYKATGSENQYYIFEPWVSPNYANGQLADSVPNYLYKATGARGVVSYDNPLYSHSYDPTITKRQSYLGTGRLKYDILPWLSIQTTNTAQYIGNNVNAYTDPRTYRGRYGGPASNRTFINGQIAITDTRSTYFLTSNMLSFNKRFGDHVVSALVGQEYGKIHTETFAASAYNTPYPGERNLGAFLTYGTYSNQQSGIAATPSAAAPVDKASFSIFSEVNDSYKGKYFASGSLRRDASTNFGQDNRYGTFYSVSGGWLISKEKFMDNIKPISNLKLRVAHGSSGREAGADYLNFSVYTDAVRYNTTTTTGSTIQRLGNDQITWETTYTTNIGLDVEFWKRINLKVDVYNRRSTNLLQTVSLPSYIGFPSQIRNVGELTNKGIDINLSSENIKSRNFQWITNFNISFNQNRLTKLYGDSLRDGFSGAYYRYVGDDLNVLRAIKYVGVNPDNGRPLFERVMADKSVVIVDSIPLAKLDGLRDYQTMGSATPKFFGGITNTFIYKNFTLSVLFNFAYGNKIVNQSVRSFLDPTAWQSGFNLPQPDNSIRFWQGPGDKTANYSNYYDLAFFQRGVTDISSSALIADASYLRLRNVRLSYDVPVSVLKRAKISSVNLYFSADNVFVIKSKDLYASDPEGATIGSTSTSYGGTGIASGMPRRFVFGINVGF